MTDSKHLTYLKVEKLAPGEHVVRWIAGWRGDDAFSGIIFLTDRRVGYCRKGTFGEKFETIGCEKISSIESSSILGFRKLVIHTSHDALTFKTAATKSELSGFIAAIEAARGKPEAPAESGNGDVLSQIASLAKLHDMGALTPEEFASKKAELLARL